MNADSFIKIDDNTEIAIDVSGAGKKVNVECGTDIDTITIGFEKLIKEWEEEKRTDENGVAKYADRCIAIINYELKQYMQEDTDEQINK